jgi:hypothetical protein
MCIGAWARCERFVNSYPEGCKGFVEFIGIEPLAVSCYVMLTLLLCVSRICLREDEAICP